MRLFQKMALQRQQLLEDLKVDRVLSRGQLFRGYGMEMHPRVLQQLDLFTFKLVCRPYTGTPDFVIAVDLVTRSRTLHQYLTTQQIVHLLGVAEIRLQMGALTRDWVSCAQQLGRTLQPDAYWATTSGTVAVEFDTGSYHSRTVARKVNTFKGEFAGVVWGTTSPVRQAEINSLHGGEVVEVITAKWWE